MTEKYLKLRDTTSSLQGLTSFLVNSNISRILALLCLPASTSLSFHKRHEGGGPSKESGGSAGHPCRSSREEAATGDTFKQLSYIHKGVTAKTGFDWRILQ